MQRGSLGTLLALTVLVASLPLAAGAPDVVVPYERGRGFTPLGELDRIVLAELDRYGIRPANPCSDEVFVRRAFLDLIGTMPTADEAQAFLADRSADKRTRLVDALLERDEYADYWSLKWGDLLRIKAEYPINLWPNAVQAYHRWIHEALRENRPYDLFARQLLTSSGSNFREPAVNFYRAIQDRSPTSIASAVALTFMGMRFEAWPAEVRDGMSAFFSRLAYKRTAEWKEEIVYHDPSPALPVEGYLPDGTHLTVPSDQDPRIAFADWLLASDNPYLARSICNRAWSWFFGRGIVHEPDDMRPDNPPTNPALLLLLERELVGAHYDLKHLFRVIVTSRTYQASPIPRSEDPRAITLFAYYPVRQLDAEVLIDALCRLDGKGEDYLSTVPEPFTILRDMRRTVNLADGTITSPFLEMFGRPARDTGLEGERSSQPTAGQRLYLLNSREVQRRISQSPWLRDELRAARNRPEALVPRLYLGILSREPLRTELQTALTYFRSSRLSVRDSAIDVAWALINSKEFLFRH